LNKEEGDLIDMSVNFDTVNRVALELKDKRRSEYAIALDFDGVCKLFSEHKHQIMSTLLFLHLYEFQRVPFKIYKQCYNYINFQSEYAGKERFLCANELARYLTQKGYNCALPGLHAAVEELQKKGLKLSEKNLKAYEANNDVSRALSWSTEVNKRVSELNEIGLTPGINENIFIPYRDVCDFFVVTTATEATLPPLMEKESIDFIARYLGQETATKAESLIGLSYSGYKVVFMFGDSLEDSRASHTAMENKADGSNIIFVPVIPGQEEDCFEKGREIIRLALAGDLIEAESISKQAQSNFRGKEVSVL
jgi:hypothetical protein